MIETSLINNNDDEFKILKVNIGSIICKSENFEDKEILADISFAVCNKYQKFFIIDNFHFKDNNYDSTSLGNVFYTTYINATDENYTIPLYLNNTINNYNPNVITGESFINDNKMIISIVDWLSRNWNDIILDNELNQSNKYELPKYCPNYYRGLMCYK